MTHSTNINSIPVTEPKTFDKVARKWNVDYAFYQTGPEKYLLFFKSGQADAITACMSEYSKLVLNKSKDHRPPILEQLEQATERVRKQSRQHDRVKEAVLEER